MPPRSNKKSSSAPRGRKCGRGRGSQRGGLPINALAERRDLFYGPGFSLADEARNTSQHNHWDSRSSLRQKPIAFVSAGTSEPLKQLDDDLLKADDSGEARPQHGWMNDRIISPDRKYNRPAGDTPTDEKRQIPVEREGGLEKVPGEGLPDLERQDEDLFFFDLKGDRTSASPSAKVPVELPERPEQPSSSSEDEIILFRGRDRGWSSRAKSTMALTQMETEIRIVEEDIRAISRDHGQSSNRNPVKASADQKRRQCTRGKRADDDALLADYIANMQHHGEIHNLVFRDTRNTRDLGGSLDEAENVPESDSESLGYGSMRLEYTNDAVQERRPSQISPQRLEGLMGDEKNHHPSSKNELNDQTLAMLITGQASSHIPDPVPTDEYVSSNLSESGRNPPQHDEFDVMDWDRPSLRRKKGKAAKVQMNFDISDSELEQTLQAAWRNDRLRKSQRKKQREELRALGMLGKKASKPEDLRVKYPTGINMQQVAEEIKAFLIGVDATLSFPPMDTHARKVIHELANKFNIKSKSTGKADQRRPMLHRTGRTLPYAEAAFNQAVAKINRRYFPRLDVKGKRTKRTTQNNNSNNPAASYREGEVVGATAPELGSENRGRAMLEKMGWSSGTALGALDNKGILQPVPQTMKKSKAGLG